MMHPIFQIYFVSLVICLIASWVGQLSEYKDLKEIGYLGFVPVVNVLMATVSVIMFVGCIGIFLVELPTIIKNHFKDEQK